jgi:transposase, IS5 family
VTGLPVLLRLPYCGAVSRLSALHVIPSGLLRDQITGKLALVSQLVHQPVRGSGKIYALHEPDVDCISKDKARVR